MPAIRVNILGNSASLELSFRKSAAAAKQLGATLNGSVTGLDRLSKAASLNVTRVAAQRTELRLLAAEYRKVARAAVRGSDQQVAAIKLATNAEKRLAATTAETGRITRRAALAGVRGIGGRARGALGGISTGGLGIAGLTAGFGVFEGLKKIVEVTREAQVEQARLRTQVNAAGLSWSRYGSQILTVLKRQQEVSGFTRFGPLKDTFTLLLRTTGKVSDALKLNALATNIARGANIDLGTAGKLVARVYSGNFGILKRYGIILGSNVKTPLQALIALSAKFTGQAAAFGKTWQGRLDKTKNSIRELSIAFGSGFLPAVTKAITGLGIFASDKKSEEHARRLGRLVGRDLGKAFKDTVAWVKANWPGIKQVFQATIGVARVLIGVLRTLKGVFGTTGVVVGLLALKFVGLRNMIGLARGAMRLFGISSVKNLGEARLALAGLRLSLAGLISKSPYVISIIAAVKVINTGWWKKFVKSVAAGVGHIPGLKAADRAIANALGMQSDYPAAAVSKGAAAARKQAPADIGMVDAARAAARRTGDRGRGQATPDAYGGVSGLNPPLTDAQRKASAAAARRAAREAAKHVRERARAQAAAVRKAAVEIQLAFKRAISKARFTTGLRDDIAAARRQVQAFKQLLALHRQDVHIQRDLVNAQTTLNTLRQKERALLASAISTMRASFGDFGAGPILNPSDAQRKRALGVPGVSAELLLKDQKAQLAQFLKIQAVFAKLGKRGAPAGLIAQLRGQGETGADLAATLANAKASTLKQIFATFKAGQRAITHAARVAISTPHVSLHANRVVFAGVGGVNDRGTTVIHTHVTLDGRKVGEGVTRYQQRTAKQSSQQTRGRHGGRPVNGT
jgi:hypothetical protein